MYDVAFLQILTRNKVHKSRYHHSFSSFLLGAEGGGGGAESGDGGWGRGLVEEGEGGLNGLSKLCLEGKRHQGAKLLARLFLFCFCFCLFFVAFLPGTSNRQGPRL